MGLALENLARLLQLPYGCGERSASFLASNIYILQYLEGTAQLIAATRETAIGYLQRGVELGSW